MLVLSRRIGEKIIIAGDIEVTVVTVQGNKVRLGVSAPPTVLVDRQEVNEGRQEWSKPWRQRSTIKDRTVPDLNPSGVSLAEVPS
jgi:carbon storage regulator